MTINARHRKHFKSGACLEYAPLPVESPVRKPRVFEPATAVLTRPAYFQPKKGWITRAVQKLGDVLMGRNLAAA